MLNPVHWRTVIFGLFSLLMFCTAPQAFAAEPDYLKEMPAAGDVIARTKGDDALDTQARRAATFARLITIMKEMQGRREFHGQTPGELRLMNEYGSQISRIQAEVIASLPPNERVGTDSKRAKWFSKSWHYEFDEHFKKEVMSTYFSPEFAKAYGYAHLDAVGRQARGAADVLGMNARQAEVEAQYAMFVETVPQPLRFLFQKWTWIIVFSAWFLAAMVREFLPFGVDDKQLKLLRVGGRSYDMNSAMGRIVEVARWTTTQVQRTTTTTTDGWGNTHTTYGSVTYYTHHVKLTIDEGAPKPREMEFTNQKIDLWNGLTVVTWWAIPKGKTWGEYVYFDVVDGNKTQYVWAFAGLMKVRLWATIPMLGFMLATGFAFWTMVGAFIGFLVVRYPLRVARELWFKAQIRQRLDIHRRAENMARADEPTVKTA